MEFEDEDVDALDLSQGSLKGEEIRRPPTSQTSAFFSQASGQFQPFTSDAPQSSPLPLSDVSQISNQPAEQQTFPTIVKGEPEPDWQTQSRSNGWEPRPYSSSSLPSRHTHSSLSQPSPLPNTAFETKPCASQQSDPASSLFSPLTLVPPNSIQQVGLENYSLELPFTPLPTQSMRRPRDEGPGHTGQFKKPRVVHPSQFSQSQSSMPSYTPLKEGREHRSSQDFSSPAYHGTKTNGFDTMKPVSPLAPLTSPLFQSSAEKSNRIPGPAGRTVINLVNDDTPLMPTKLKYTEFVSGAAEVSKSECGQAGGMPLEDDEDFLKGPWISLLHKCKVTLNPLTEHPGDPAVLLSTDEGRFLFENHSQALKERAIMDSKVGVLAFLVASVKIWGDDAHLQFKDPWGVIEGTVHFDAVKAHPKLIAPGAAVVLQNISVFSPTEYKHYIMITEKNIFQVWPSTTSVPFHRQLEHHQHHQQQQQQKQEYNQQGLQQGAPLFSLTQTSRNQTHHQSEITDLEARVHAEASHTLSSQPSLPNANPGSALLQNSRSQHSPHGQHQVPEEAQLQTGQPHPSFLPQPTDFESTKLRKPEAAESDSWQLLEATETLPPNMTAVSSSQQQPVARPVYSSQLQPQLVNVDKFQPTGDDSSESKGAPTAGQESSTDLLEDVDALFEGLDSSSKFGESPTFSFGGLQKLQQNDSTCSESKDSFQSDEKQSVAQSQRREVDQKRNGSSLISESASSLAGSFRTAKVEGEDTTAGVTNVTYAAALRLEEDDIDDLLDGLED
mmetsp:Transcript_8008/g.15307  ORF Transcript_8008/g.15307 Transcript_8008/m.15307 type:complete len:781 (+) Transcript_8008:28-2370(+)